DAERLAARDVQVFAQSQEGNQMRQWSGSKQLGCQQLRIRLRLGPQNVENRSLGSIEVETAYSGLRVKLENRFTETSHDSCRHLVAQWSDASNAPNRQQR